MIKLKCILQPKKIQNRDGGKFMFDIQETSGEARSLSDA